MALVTKPKASGILINDLVYREHVGCSGTMTCPTGVSCRDCPGNRVWHTLLWDQKLTEDVGFFAGNIRCRDKDLQEKANECLFSFIRNFSVFPWYIKVPKDITNFPGKLAYIKRLSDTARQEPNTGDWIEPRFTISSPGKILRDIGYEAYYGHAACALVAEAVTKALSPYSQDAFEAHITNDPESIHDLYNIRYSEGTPEDPEAARPTMHTCMEDTIGPMAYGRPGNLGLLWVTDKKYHGKPVLRCIIRRTDRMPPKEDTPQESSYLTPRIYMLGSNSSRYANGSALSTAYKAALESFVSKFVTLDENCLEGCTLRRYTERGRIALPYLDGYYQHVDEDELLSGASVFTITSDGISATITSGEYVEEETYVCQCCDNAFTEDEFNFNRGMCCSCVAEHEFCPLCGEYRWLEDDDTEPFVDIRGYTCPLCPSCYEQEKARGYIVKPENSDTESRIGRCLCGSSGKFYEQDYDIIVAYACNTLFVPDQGELLVRFEGTFYEASHFFAQAHLHPLTVETTGAYLLARRSQ